MSASEKSREYACLGSDWPEHEDYLIGNKDGFIRLKAAIDEALEKGESKQDPGDFVGVRCLETEFFENGPKKVSKWSSLLGGAIVIAIAAIFIIGLITVFSWFGESCK
jgi:hypothetical protein